MTSTAAPAGAEAPEAADEAATNERMWRKVVAFTREQETGLKRLAGDEGNVSEVIRAAVDEYLERQAAL